MIIVVVILAIRLCSYIITEKAIGLFNSAGISQHVELGF